MFPITAVVPIVAPVGLDTHVFVKSKPAFATGAVLFTVTVTWSEPRHPSALITVSEYVVVTLGFAIGFAIIVEFNPVAGLHK